MSGDRADNDVNEISQCTEKDLVESAQQQFHKKNLYHKFKYKVKKNKRQYARQ